jgi:hypothetical protein
MSSPSSPSSPSPPPHAAPNASRPRARKRAIHPISPG